MKLSKEQIFEIEGVRESGQIFERSYHEGGSYSISIEIQEDGWTVTRQPLEWDGGAQEWGCPVGTAGHGRVFKYYFKYFTDEIWPLHNGLIMIKCPNCGQWFQLAPHMNKLLFSSKIFYTSCNNSWCRRSMDVIVK